MHADMDQVLKDVNPKEFRIFIDFLEQYFNEPLN